MKKPRDFVRRLANHPKHEEHHKGRQPRQHFTDPDRVLGALRGEHGEHDHRYDVLHEVIARAICAARSWLSFISLIIFAMTAELETMSIAATNKL